MIILENIDIEPILKAQMKFNHFCSKLDTDVEKTAAIKGFEYCYELSWKLMKRILKKKGIDISTPRDTFREAALAKLIEDPVLWFKFIELRNLTVHTYNEDTTETVIKQLPEFKKEFEQFLDQAKQL